MADHCPGADQAEATCRAQAIADTSELQGVIAGAVRDDMIRRWAAVRGFQAATSATHPSLALRRAGATCASCRSARDTVRRCGSQMTRFEQLALDEALGIAMASQIMTASLLLHVAERDPSGIPALRETLDAHAKILESPHAAACYSRAALGLARSLLASRAESLAEIEQGAG